MSSCKRTRPSGIICEHSTISVVSIKFAMLRHGIVGAVVCCVPRSRPFATWVVVVMAHTQAHTRWFHSGQGRAVFEKRDGHLSAFSCEHKAHVRTCQLRAHTCVGVMCLAVGIGTYRDGRDDGAATYEKRLRCVRASIRCVCQRAVVGGGAYWSAATSTKRRCATSWTPSTNTRQHTEGERW